MMQQRAERYQHYWNSRNTKLAMGVPSGPLYGLSDCQTEIRDMYCDGCRHPKDYVARIDDPDWRQYPQDDNHYTPAYDTISLMELVCP
jgi:hypothetical protein